MCSKQVRLPDLKEVHFWTVDDFPLDESMASILNPEECEKYARIRAIKVKKQYLQTRLALRHILSLYHQGKPPSSWQFVKNTYGRPALSGDEFSPSLVFNISHTRGALVIGFARAGELGVDVEYTQRQARVIALADRYFSPEEVQELLSLPPEQQKARFFDLWTLKEAYIKACGMGLALSLASFSYRFSANGIGISFAPGRDDVAARWEFWQLQLSPQHRAAIAFAAESKVQPTSLHGFRLCGWDKVQAQELTLIRCSEPLV